MPILSLPVEINLTIIGEILKPKDGLHSSNDDTDTDSDHSLHKAARRQRLASFRDIACISKAWVDPARTAFWKEINIFSIRELVALAHAFDKPSAKPTCIRSVYFRFPDFLFRSGSSERHLAEEALTCFPVILHYLPAHLDVLHVNCPYNYSPLNEALYKCMQAACRDHTWAIEVPKLIIGARPLHCDIFPYFAFARNVVQLVLNVNQYDTEETFSSSPHSMQLESFSIQMTFDGPTLYNHPMSSVTKAVSQVLRSACMELRSLVITLFNACRIDPKTCANLRAVKHILSLCGPSTNNLDLRAVRFSCNISKELAEAEIVVRCPALRCLRLNKFGVHPDFFRQLGCSELRQLEVDMPQDDVDASAVRGDGDTLLNLLASLELPELANLERLEITEEIAYPSRPPIEVWLPLERACAARNIACSIRHPRRTLQATS
ncbi:hypothetical protein PILCRDRAFT_10315 [Piloderma croceum F 1598]|uniref:F-box domain-containing protein n=1 Tax=Piloderma croceum (strain F 1598) TaxID=765440 RepID=A0A0C3FI78_PILCF|nr:hypothetical protein PILCRDRAFT_10315 [Piloderma croceum F 1598]